MKFSMIHENYNVGDLDRSMEFYREALGLEERETGRRWDLPCRGLFAAIGRIPETGLVREQVQLDPAGYILADETTRTNLPGVFAAGDIRSKPLRQIVTAAADGAVAAHLAGRYLAQR